MTEGIEEGEEIVVQGIARLHAEAYVKRGEWRLKIRKLVVASLQLVFEADRLCEFGFRFMKGSL